MKYLLVMTMIVISFGMGVIMGWDSGVRDARSLYSQTP